MTIKIGQIYEGNAFGKNIAFILAQVDAKVSLISLNDGNYWQPGVRINNPNNITSDEFIKMCDILTNVKFMANNLSELLTTNLQGSLLVATKISHKIDACDYDYAMKSI